jgi:hypothetical protein
MPDNTLLCKILEEVMSNNLYISYLDFSTNSPSPTNNMKITVTSSIFHERLREELTGKNENASYRNVKHQ